MGITFIEEARRVVTVLSQNELYQKIREETKGDIMKLETDLLVQKGLEDRLKQFYDKQLEQMKQQNSQLLERISAYETSASEVKEEIQQAIKLELEKLYEDKLTNAQNKYNAVIESKDKQIATFGSIYEKLVQQQSKSASQKGQEGEKTFEDFADTFKDFNGFHLDDKHTQGGAGDFHMHFADFSVLVDAKNYKKKVPIEQRDKIKKDLTKHEHIPFAWLVSLNTAIDKYDKAPVMYEWINTEQCIVYINNLLSFESPSDILRIVWFTCKELTKFIDKGVEVDDDELKELKEKQFKMNDKIKNMRRKIRSLNTALNGTRSIIQDIDDDLRSCLDTETGQLVESNWGLFDKWWDESVELTNDENCKVSSTDLWFKFKRDNKKLLDEFEVTTDQFRKFIKMKMPMESIVFKSKSENSAFEVKGLKLTQNVAEPEAKINDLLLVTPSKKEKKKQEPITVEYYIDKDTDNAILNAYNKQDNDILDIAKGLGIEVYKIVSTLMKHKVITNRAQSRGYDKYKETAEYKNKVSLK